MAYHSCKNCNHPFGTSHKYCPNCGLKQTGTLTVKALFNNTIQNYFAFDARFFKSIIPLLINPGFLPKQFVAGKRLTYLHPAQLYLFSTILFFFIFSFQTNLDAEDMDASMDETFFSISEKEDELEINKAIDSLSTIIKEEELKLTEDEAKILRDKEALSNLGFKNKGIDSLIAIKATDKAIYKEMGLADDANYFTRKLYKQGLKFYKNHSVGSIYKQFIGSLPIALFFLLPIFALLLRLFYYRRTVYVNHLVFSFYYFAFAFFLLSINVIINFIGEIGYYNLILFAWLFIYLVIAIKNYYNKTWIGTFFKTLLLLFTYFSFVIPIALALTLVLSFMFY